MRKKRNVLDRTIALVDKKKTKAEEEFCSFTDVSEDLALLDRFFPNDSKDYEVLRDMSSDEFNTLLSKLYNASEDDIVKILNGSFYVIKNDIPLFDSQISKLNDFVNRVQGLRKRLNTANRRFNSLMAKIKDYEELERDLAVSKKDGIIDVDLIDKIAIVLDLNEKDKVNFLYEVMEFNLGNYQSLQLQDSVVLDSKKEVIDLDALKKVFSKYGYEISTLDSKYIKSLQEEGNLENIEGVFKAITANKMNFLQEKRKVKLLTQFLLFSNENIINEVCSKFKENYVSSSFFTSYLPVFFPSEDKREIKRTRRKRSVGTKDKKEVTDSKDDLNVKGLHRDFLKNLDYISENFDVEKKTLLERGIRVLTLPHDALIRHIEELELYGYNIHDEKFPLSALGASRIMDSTDSFIEIGEENYIKRYSSRLLFTCSDIAKRIYAYKESNLEYRSEGGRVGTIKTDVVNLSGDCELAESTIKRLVPDDVEDLLANSKCKELLDSYSPRKISKATLEDPVIMELEERFKVDDSMYRIDDIVISRRKVLRNYEFLVNNTSLLPVSERDTQKMLLVATINNSLLNSSEIERIDRAVGEVLAYNGGKNGFSKK